ncbi:hypothetical protein B0H14DRAFT_3436446 [Mycena olivaceomarginata]|nr:hypothetical protein B0H14DRAFT_2603513 [Mycena olivaceomarginata]KAJ7876697.1 hypothetical protein B0H14DRAFT_3436446 [Mycena olivaceomarginata]
MFLTPTTRTLIAFLPQILSLAHGFDGASNAHRFPRGESRSTGLNESRSISKMRRQMSAEDLDLLTAHEIYYLNMSFGSPEQTFRMQIDTGSGDTFISVFCPDCDGPGFASIYEPNKSTTAVNK